MIKIYSMKGLMFMVVLVVSAQLHAQQLTGLWHSADKTRTYEISQSANGELVAIIKSSSRNADSVGYRVIKQLIFNEEKKRYEGVMFAMSDGQPAFVRIKFDTGNEDRLLLKIDRVFLPDVSITWERVQN